tara:strand:- start:180 stop:401 length:222 start_codon:yes stop_codon:yes gene_type:complete
MSHYKNPNNLPSLVDFTVLCNNHDWTFAYSDDHSAYRRGSLELTILMECIKQGGIEYEQVYNRFAKERLPTYV